MPIKCLEKALEERIKDENEGLGGHGRADIWRGECPLWEQKVKYTSHLQ